MKLFSVALIATLAGSVAANSSPFSTFNDNDIKHFLRDLKVDVDENTPSDKLNEQAQEEFDKLQAEYKNRKFTIDVTDDGQQQILNLATDPNADLSVIFPHNLDYLTNKDLNPSGDYYSQVKNWIFESWTIDNLKSFLKSNGISYDKTSTRQDLIDSAKSSWDDILEKFQVSGNYAGDWLYQGWSIDDVKNWLKEHDLTYEEDFSREDLLKMVKENNYIASLSNIDNKQSLLDSLKLLERLIFDDAGKIKDDFINEWNYSQLREWLYIHGLIDTKPDVEAKDLDIDKLQKMVKSHENYLVNDIKSWIESTKDHVDPYIGKKSDSWQKTLDNFINSSFLVGIDNWSKDRLKEFLKVRNVKFSQFSTKRQLIELVKSLKNIPVKTQQAIGVPSNWYFDSWSTEAIRQWLQEKGEKVDGSRQELINSIAEYYQSLQENASKSIDEQIKNYKPDLDEYKKSIEESYQATKEKAGETNSIADETLLAAYSISIEHYNQVAKVLKNKYKDNRFEVNDALQKAQQASYEYSQQLINNSKEIKVKDNIEAAVNAATLYADDLSNQLIETYKIQKPKVEEFIDEAQNYLKYFGNYVNEAFQQHKPKAEQVAQDAYASAQKVANDAYESAKDYADSANGVLNEKYQEVKPHVDEAVEQLKQYASAAHQNYIETKPKVAEAYNQANEIAQSAYSQANEKAQLAYSEYKPKVVDTYNDVNEAAWSAYGEYKPIVEEAARVAYESAQSYGADANEAVQLVYGEYKPKIQDASRKSWDYVLESWSNADLKQYLNSFGFDSNFLNELNRGSLLKLSQEQLKLFYGDSKSKWDKPIVNVFTDASAQLQKKLGLSPKPTSVWDRLRGYF